MIVGLKEEDYEKIVALKATKTLQEIADIYGVSRQRIHQIIKKRVGKVQRVPKLTGECPVCHKFYLMTKTKKNFICLACQEYEIYHKKHPLAKNITRRYQIKPFCKKCKVKPTVLRGVCKNCYWKTPEGKLTRKRFMDSHKEQLQKYSHDYYMKHREHLKAWTKNYYETHPEKRAKRIAQIAAWGKKHKNRRKRLKGNF